MSHKLTDDEILDKVNNMPMDELWADNSKLDHDRRYQEEKRTPLYVVMAVVLIIAIINSVYFHSDGVLLVCVTLGGGIWIYLWQSQKKYYQKADRSKRKDRSK